MISRNFRPWLAVAMLAAPAGAQQSPDNVSSDSNNNTAMGYNALLAQSSGSQSAHDNSAAGTSTLHYTTSGHANTGMGSNVLTFNTTGSENSGVGYGALYRNTTGNSNDAFGVSALNDNTAGSQNVAFGEYALQQNTDGSQNTAVGLFTLSDSDGSNDTAIGSQSIGFAEFQCLSQSTAIGASAMMDGCGAYNTAVGFEAMASGYLGSHNIAVGYLSGAGITSNITGPNPINSSTLDIDIGNQGVYFENSALRIGTTGTHNNVFVAGVANPKVIGAALYVTMQGQLGTLASSRRYKTAIRSLTAPPPGLAWLRPVTFHLKNAPDGELQFGLIAEQVETILPDLVIHNDHGVVEGVRYEELSPLLLAAFKHQGAKLQRRALLLARDEQQLTAQLAMQARLKTNIDRLNRQLRARLTAIGSSSYTTWGSAP